MARVVNPTPFPEALYRKLGPGGREYEVLSVRGTFRFTADDSPLLLASEQRPIRWQATLDGDDASPFDRVVVDDSDVLIGKPASEVQVYGTLRAPDDRPRSQWQISVHVGSRVKHLRVYGPREFRQGFFGGWRLSAPEPTRAVALDYRHAFGGHFLPTDATDPATQTLYHPANPAGCGWLPSRADYKRLPKALVKRLKRRILDVTRLPAPQLEDPSAPVTSPFSRIAPTSLGPIAPWWSPRVDYQGTFDADWKAHHAPGWPADFDPRYHHAAPADLIADGYLRGDEPVVLINCLPDSQPIAIGERWLFRHRTRLPGIALRALSEHASGRRGDSPLVLDTVGIDLDRGELSLTWRVLFAPDDPLTQVRLRRLPLAHATAPEVAHVG